MLFALVRVMFLTIFPFIDAHCKDVCLGVVQSLSCLFFVSNGSNCTQINPRQSTPTYTADAATTDMAFKLIAINGVRLPANRAKADVKPNPLDRTTVGKASGVNSAVNEKNTAKPPLAIKVHASRKFHGRCFWKANNDIERMVTPDEIAIPRVLPSFQLNKKVKQYAGSSASETINIDTYLSWVVKDSWDARKTIP